MNLEDDVGVGANKYRTGVTLREISAPGVKRQDVGGDVSGDDVVWE